MNTLILILGWVIFGGIVGVLARALFPGTQSMGWLGTITLGVLGSFLGGGLGNFLFGGGQILVVRPAGWIGSLLGALIALGVFVLLCSIRDRRV